MTIKQTQRFDFGNPEQLKAATATLKEMAARFEADNKLKPEEMSVAAKAMLSDFEQLNKPLADKIQIGEGTTRQWFNEHPATKTAVAFLVGATGLGIAAALTPMAWLYEKVTGKSQGLINIRASDGHMLLGRGD